MSVVLGLALAAGCAAGAGLSVTAGGGVSGGDDQIRTAGPAVGASFEWWRLQADYLFNSVYPGGERRNFATLSWVWRARAGRARPFFQAGGGVVHRSFRTASWYPSGAVWRDETDTGLAVLFGGGVTVAVGKSMYIRPQVRLYGHVGPTLTLLPGVAVGWGF